MNTTNTLDVASADAPKCPECDGYGTLGGQLLPCFDCKGTGRVTYAKQYIQESAARQQLAAAGAASTEADTEYTAWLSAHPELRGFSIAAKGHLIWRAAQEQKGQGK